MTRRNRYHATRATSLEGMPFNSNGEGDKYTVPGRLEEELRLPRLFDAILTPYEHDKVR